MSLETKTDFTPERQPRRAKVAAKLGQVGAIAYKVNGETEVNNPKAKVVARAMAATGSSGLLLRSILPDHDRLIGVGSQSLVFGDGETVRKKEFSSAGMSDAALERRNAQRQEEYDEAVDQFGRLVHPTTFSIGELHLRPAGRLAVSEASQQFVAGGVDALSPAGLGILGRSAPDSTLRQDVMALVDGMSVWRQEDKWLDVLGRNNILITPDADPRLAIIDADRFLPSSDLASMRWGERYMENLDNLQNIADSNLQITTL